MSFYGFMHAGLGAARVVKAESSAIRSKHEAGKAARSVKELEDKIDKLTLVCLSMWSLLIEKTDLTEQQLMERVKVIDMQDGNPDGKISTKIKKCLKCNRTRSPKHKRCLYCGAEETKLSAFDDVT